jgi:hypothetical protein
MISRDSISLSLNFFFIVLKLHTPGGPSWIVINILTCYHAIYIVSSTFGLIHNQDEDTF